MDVSDRTIDANLLFLNAKVGTEDNPLDVVAGVGAFVNVQKPKDTDKTDRKYGRLTRGEFNRIRKRDLVEISGIIGAAIDLGDGRLFVDPSAFGGIAEYIPQIEFGGGVQIRKEFNESDSQSSDNDSSGRSLTSSNSPLHPLADVVVGPTGNVRRHFLQDTTRAKKFREKRGTIRRRQRLLPKAVPLSDVDIDTLVDIRHHHDSRAVPLMHSLHRTLTFNRRRRRGLRSLISQDEFLKTGGDFATSFAACPIKDTNKTFCGNIKDVGVSLESIKEAVLPIVSKFVDIENGDGYLDKIAKPLQPLNKEQKALSELLRFEVTILNVADIYLGKEITRSDTVRKILEIYDTIRGLVKRFSGDGNIIIAEICDLSDGGFNCTGGLVDDDADARRLQLDSEEHGMAEIYGFIDQAGQPMTPRHLITCNIPTFKQDDDENKNCQGDCSGITPTSCKAKCIAAKLKCQATGIEGLSFPAFDNPLLLLDLIKGESISLVDFSPPEVVFGME